MHIDRNRRVSIQVTNTGKAFGKEVVQMYIGFPETSGEPPKQLKGFKKIALNPDQSTAVIFDVTERDLSIWDTATHKWKIQQGTFKIMIGSSSRDIKA